MTIHETAAALVALHGRIGAIQYAHGYALFPTTTADETRFWLLVVAAIRNPR